ncbi:uncharacterized protein LOC130656990 isoform X2 [Hydractinia symbiolongicarpus]|uniref:uncharacterized protein LOC130656990 isoform X2 n=1 Tax=Hydractinia symbiolongicarpus TaxID=13093 RepID=UPI00254A203C|nr:uncharacterized protein LOC130656990 isoform X2 [Hydractinia symbiolongicarpus]
MADEENASTTADEEQMRVWREHYGNMIPEKIVDTKIGEDGRRYYKVQWAASTMEPSKNFLEAELLIKKYWDPVEKKLKLPNNDNPTNRDDDQGNSSSNSSEITPCESSSSINSNVAPCESSSSNDPKVTPCKNLSSNNSEVTPCENSLSNDSKDTPCERVTYEEKRSDVNKKDFQPTSESEITDDINKQDKTAENQDKDAEHSTETSECRDTKIENDLNILDTKSKGENFSNTRKRKNDEIQRTTKINNTCPNDLLQEKQPEEKRTKNAES